MTRKKVFFGLFLAMAALFSTFGCATLSGINTSVENSTVMTGLFKNPQEAREVSKNLKRGTTRCPEDLKEAGFDPNAKNVIQLPGAKGAEYFLGTANPQIVVNDPDLVDKIKEKFRSFLTYLYPIEEVSKQKDRAYWKKQNSSTSGTKGVYFIVCQNNLVDNHDYSGEENIDKPVQNNQFGGNVLDSIFGGALRGAGKVFGF